MEQKELLEAAREDYQAALALAQKVIDGDVALTIGGLLESYVCLKHWYQQLKEESEQTDDVLQLRQQCLDYLMAYEEEIFFDFETDILAYFKEKKIEGFTSDELKAARIFIDAAEQNIWLAIKDWRQFLPEQIAER